ncbi:MAG: hypothetical protein IPN17_05980 [Deltaproteobacteria bacterium]|nr:hypothetical protein [Deltaproteobacteria bacterium]MBK8691852.1 hypothetical protein [Deltaproteobacteria bacterium]
MNDLSPETRALLASLSSSHDPPPEMALRVRERVDLRVASSPSLAPQPAWMAWAGLGITLLALAWWATRAPSPVAPAPLPRPVPALVTPVAPTALPVIAAPSPSPSVIEAPAPPPTVPVAVAPREERDDLPAELRWIERAQTALAANDPAAAQAALRGHARAFPRGHLSEEREALAVQVLCASGRADEARRAAAVFIARHPTSPQAARVRRTCVDAR